METAGEESGEKKGENTLSNNWTILILPGVSKAHQAEGKKEIYELIVLCISSFIFPAKRYTKTKPIFSVTLIYHCQEYFS